MCEPHCLSLAATSSSLSLCANMTSSIKPEVHKIYHYAARRGLSHSHWYTHIHTPIYGPFSGTTRVSWNQKCNTILDFTEVRDSEWQWHQLGYMQVCTSLQTDNHASTSPLSFLQAGCPSCHLTNSIKALKAIHGPIHDGP